MTDSEIIKALEHCAGDGYSCTGCAYDKLDYSGDYHCCDYYLKQAALSIIKRQQAEIEELNTEIDKKYGQAVADIKGNLANGGVSCHWCIEQTKAETIKEFAKKLKRKAYRFPCAIGTEYAVPIRAINETAGDEE